LPLIEVTPFSAYVYSLTVERYTDAVMARALAGVSLKVAADAIRVAGPMAAALSLLVGAAVFSASNALVARFGAAHRKRCGDCIQQPAESQQPGSGVAIALARCLRFRPPAACRRHDTLKALLARPGHAAIA